MARLERSPDCRSSRPATFSFPKQTRTSRSIVDGQAVIPLQALADAATVAWDCNLGAKAKVTLGGNRTMGAVSNAIEGAAYVLWVIQDATGNRTVNWTGTGSGSFDFGNQGPPTLSADPGTADMLTFEAIAIGGTLKLRLVAFNGGFSGSDPYAGLNWAAIGSSITSQGFYTGPLNTLLGTALTNLGYSGHDLTTGLGASGIYDRIAQIPANADLVTFDGFINDFSHNAPLGVLGDTVTTTFYGALLSAANAVLAANPHRILVMMTHYEITLAGPNWQTPNGNGNTQQQFNQAIRDVAAVVGAYLVDCEAESPVNHTTAATYLSDGLHLNTAGGNAQAQYLAGKIEAIAPYGGLVAQAPAFAPAGGAYASAQSVAISSATPGAGLRYTVDGSPPTVASPVVIGNVNIAQDATLKAIAVKSGFDLSPVTSDAYTIANTVATPTFAPAAGTYGSAQSVTISCATAGATIHYTTDGNDPTTSSPVYSAPINVAASQTLKALAVKAGSNDSAIATAAYTISSSGAWSTALSVTMTMNNSYPNIGIVSRLFAASLSLPSGTIQKIRVTIKGNVGGLAIGPQAASGDAYDAASLTPITFGGSAQVAGTTGETVSDEIPFTWDKIGDLMISAGEASAGPFGHLQSTSLGTSNWAFNGGSFYAQADKPSGWSTAANTIYCVTKIEFFA
ncbi:MAG: chitobiase/beta-hexosaminidase C-terminal domain-containing protein [Hyphomicrobiaceae bacterium]